MTQQTLNALTCNKQYHINLTFIPTALLSSVVKDAPSQIKHFALPMVHPVTSEMISSYKKMMHDPDTSEIWQIVFCKDFGGMAQADNKTGQKGTNAMFVMRHDEIKHVYGKVKNSLTEILYTIMGHKKKTQTRFILQLGVISSCTSPACPYA